MKESLLYKIVRPIVSVWFKIFYKPKYIGLEYIPKNEKVILAGNHKNNLDCIYLISSTKRTIHFLAKKELFSGLKKIIFNNMGLIPVDRGNSEKRHEAFLESIKYLENDKVIGIFPEGTHNKSNDVILPFKIGAVKMSKDADSQIVPFVIKGEYKKFRKDVRIIFFEPFKAKSNDLDKENEKFMKLISKKLTDSEV